MAFRSFAGEKFNEAISLIVTIIEVTAEEFGSLFARRLQARDLWVFRHGMVIVIGFGPMALSV